MAKLGISQWQRHSSHLCFKEEISPQIPLSVLDIISVQELCCRLFFGGLTLPLLVLSVLYICFDYCFHILLQSLFLVFCVCVCVYGYLIWRAFLDTGHDRWPLCLLSVLHCGHCGRGLCICPSSAEDSQPPVLLMNAVVDLLKKH